MPWQKENDLGNNPAYLEPRITELENRPTFSGDYNELVNKPDLSQIAKILDEGSANFNSTTGTIIPHSIGHTNYFVRITPTQNPNGYLGEVWIEKSATSFKVCCSGTATTSFEYVVI